MGWFSKKPSWEDTYAERIYEALVAPDDLGEMTPERLHIPTAAMQRYIDKALLQRELMCFVALISLAGPGTNLRPVMMAFSKLLIKNMTTRGIRFDVGTFAEASKQDVEEMFRSRSSGAKAGLRSFAMTPMITTWW